MSGIGAGRRALGSVALGLALALDLAVASGAAAAGAQGGGRTTPAAPPASPPAAAATAKPAAAAAAIGSTTDFTFPLFNDTYSQNGAVMAPIVQGGMTIRLSSPENRLTLRTHRVRLTPLADGTHRAEFLADFTGRGRVVADLVAAGGRVSRLQDEVVVPPQTRTIIGRVLLARGDGAYEITPVELPQRVPVAIESQLAGSFSQLCAGLAALPMLAIDCGGIEQGLATVAVPLPATGDTYLIPDERLTPDDRRRLDAYLAAFREAL